MRIFSRSSIKTSKHCCTPSNIETHGQIFHREKNDINDDSFSSQHLEFQKQSFRHSAREQNTIQIWSLHRLFGRIARREDETTISQTRPQTAINDNFSPRRGTQDCCTFFGNFLSPCSIYFFHRIVTTHMYIHAWWYIYLELPGIKSWLDRTNHRHNARDERAYFSPPSREACVHTCRE